MFSFSELKFVSDIWLIYSDEFLYYRDVQVYLRTGGCRNKLIMRVAKADHFHDSVDAVDLLWVYCRVLWPLCILTDQAVLGTKAQILKFKLTIQGSLKLPEVM